MPRLALGMDFVALFDAFVQLLPLSDLPHQAGISWAVLFRRIRSAGGAGAGAVAVNEQRSGDSGDIDGKGTDGKSDRKNEKIVKGMYRVGCLARIVQMGRVSGGESFKV